MGVISRDLYQLTLQDLLKKTKSGGNRQNGYVKKLCIEHVSLKMSF